MLLYSMGEDGAGKETQDLLDLGEGGAAFTVAQRQGGACGGPRSPESSADELTPRFMVGWTPSSLKGLLSSF